MKLQSIHIVTFYSCIICNDFPVRYGGRLGFLFLMKLLKGKKKTKVKELVSWRHYYECVYVSTIHLSILFRVSDKLSLGTKMKQTDRTKEKASPHRIITMCSSSQLGKVGFGVGFIYKEEEVFTNNPFTTQEFVQRKEPRSVTPLENSMWTKVAYIHE